MLNQPTYDKLVKMRMSAMADAYRQQAEPKEVVDYREKITVLQYALEQYTNRDEGQDVPESVIEAFVTKIVVSQDGFDWYLRFDGDPDDPLHCKIEGKRKNTTKIVVAGANSPAVHRSATGRYQGLSDFRKFWKISSSKHDPRLPIRQAGIF